MTCELLGGEIEADVVAQQLQACRQIRQRHNRPPQRQRLELQVQSTIHTEVCRVTPHLLTVACMLAQVLRPSFVVQGSSCPCACHESGAAPTLPTAPRPAPSSMTRWPLKPPAGTAAARKLISSGAAFQRLCPTAYVPQEFSGSDATCGIISYPF